MDSTARFQKASLIMARKPPVPYPGAMYHLMNRGDHSEAIFRDSHDPELFRRTLSEACGKTDWQVQAFCLMPNHFHRVVETPRASLADGMKSAEGQSYGAGLLSPPSNANHKRK